MQSHTGEALSLRDLSRRGPLIIYFYPKDFTPVCTRQACALRDEFGELAARGARVIGISPDDDATHLRFAREHNVPFPLVADPQHELARRFDVMGMFGLTLKRVTFVVAPGGRIVRTYRHELRASKHISAILETLDSLAQK